MAAPRKAGRARAPGGSFAADAASRLAVALTDDGGFFGTLRARGPQRSVGIGDHKTGWAHASYSHCVPEFEQEIGDPVRGILRSAKGLRRYVHGVDETCIRERHKKGPALRSWDSLGQTGDVAGVRALLREVAHGLRITETSTGSSRIEPGPMPRRDDEPNRSETTLNGSRLAGILIALSGSRQVTLVGVRITNTPGERDINLRGIRLHSELIFERCEIEGTLVATNSEIGALKLRSGRVMGGIRLNNARLAGDLMIGAAIGVGGDRRMSIEAANAQVGGELRLKGGAQLDAPLEIAGASVTGSLRIDGEVSIGPHEDTKLSVIADRLTLGGNITIKGPGVDLKGGVRVATATVRGDLWIRDGVQVGRDNAGRSLACGGLVLGGSLRIGRGEYESEDPSTDPATGGPPKFAGGIRLAGGSVGGHLVVRGDADVGKDDGRGWSLDAGGLDVDGEVLIEGPATNLCGGIRLAGASIDGRLRICRGATVGHTNDRRSMVLDRIRIGWNLQLGAEETSDDNAASAYTTRFVGGVRILDGEVHGQFTVVGPCSIGVLNESSARSKSPPPTRSIDASGLRTVGNLIVSREAMLEGGLNLVGGSVGGVLSVRGEARITGEVDLARADVTELALDGTGEIGEVLDLRHARIKLLRDKPKGWDRLGAYRLSDVSIAAIARIEGEPETTGDRGDVDLQGRWRWSAVVAAIGEWFRRDKRPGKDPGEWGWEARAAWLARAEYPSLGAYREVAANFRRSGLHDDARQLEIAGEIRTSSLRRTLRWWVVGFGYTPFRPVMLALAPIVVLWFTTLLVGPGQVFVVADQGSASVERVGSMESEDPVEAGASVDCPALCFPALQYITETVVPLIDTGQRDSWSINPDVGGGQIWPPLVEPFLMLMGWVLAILATISVHSLIRRDR